MTGEMPSPSFLHPLPKRIIRNTLYNTAGNWLILVLNFLVIPFVIKSLGVEMYGGVWILGMVVISYAGLFDFGVQSSCIKFIAEYSAQNKGGEINRVVSTAMAFYLVFGGLLLVSAILAGRVFLSFIGVPPHLLGDAYFVLLIAMVIVLVTNTLAPMTMTVTALQRMDVSNMVLVSTNVLNLIQTVTILKLGLGVRGLILGSLGVQLISTLWLTYWSRRLLPAIRPHPSDLNKQTLGRLWRYGANLQVSRVAQIVVFQTDKIVALKFFGASSAAFYEVAVKVSSLARNIPLVLTSALLPAASEMDAKNEELKVAFLYERGSKYLLMVGTLLLGFVFLESRSIVVTWIGKSLGETGVVIASMLIKILIIGYFLNMVTGVASTVAAGVGRTDIERRVGILILIITPMLLVVLYRLVGLYGVAFSTTISLGVSAMYYMKLFSAAMRKEVWHFWELFLRPLTSALVAMALTTIVQYLLFDPDVRSRMQGMLMLGFLFGAFTAVYIGVLYLLRTLDEYDKVVFKTLVTRLGRWRKNP